MTPHATGVLATRDGQELYWETVGDPHGRPAVYLHGGPGSGSGEHARRYFTGYRGVLMDQRGAGRSRPSAVDPGTSLESNTTQHLVADLELLREHLGIDRWTVVGVSWGVTLGLVYAQTHPERVEAMVLGAVTAGTRREISWITRDMGRVFPREWEAFARDLPPDELPAAYARLLADPATRDAAAKAWCDWEDTHVSLMPGWSPDPRYQDPGFRYAFARMVTHYWGNDCFLTDGQVERDLRRISHLPAVLLHGRHDVSSPLDTAWRLHRAWPASELVVLGDAGHGGAGFAEQVTAALAHLL